MSSSGTSGGSSATSKDPPKASSKPKKGYSDRPLELPPNETDCPGCDGRKQKNKRVVCFACMGRILGPRYQALFEGYSQQWSRWGMSPTEIEIVEDNAHTWSADTPIFFAKHFGPARAAELVPPDAEQLITTQEQLTEEFTKVKDREGDARIYGPFHEPTGMKWAGPSLREKDKLINELKEMESEGKGPESRKCEEITKLDHVLLRMRMKSEQLHFLDLSIDQEAEFLSK